MSKSLDLKTNNNHDHNKSQDYRLLYKPIKKMYSFKQYLIDSRIFRFSVFDIAMAGLLIGIFLVCNKIMTTTLTGRFAFKLDYLFFILYGLILGPFKGSVLAILSDTFSLVIRGRIAFWMIEYAIIPPLIAFITWLVFYLYKFNSKFTFLLPFILHFIAAAIILSVFITKTQEIGFKFTIKDIEDKSKSIESYVVSIFVYVFLAISFIFICVFTFLSLKYAEKTIYKLILYSFVLVLLCIVVFRWTWGPIAFVRYYNQFIIPARISKGGSAKPYLLEERYIFLMVPILIKGLIVIPSYTAILTLLLPTILKLIEKHRNLPKY